MELAEAAARFLEARRLADRSPATIRLYERQLDAWRAWCSARQQTTCATTLTPDQIQAYLAYLHDTHVPHGGRVRHPSGRLAANTRASVFRTLRTFWRFCGQKKWLTPDEVRDLGAIAGPSVPRRPRPALDRTVLRKLLAACDELDDETAARNRALLGLLFDTGARIAELCSVTDGDVDLKKRRALVIAKGGDTRPIFWQAAAAAALAQYLLNRRGGRGGALPLLRGTSSRNSGGPLTTDAARAMIKRLAKTAGVKLPHGAPVHSIRHGFARRAITAGADISDVSQLLGHKDIATTMIYLTQDEDRLQDAYDRIFGRSGERDSRQQDAESHDRKPPLSDRG